MFFMVFVAFLELMIFYFSPTCWMTFCSQTFRDDDAPFSGTSSAAISISRYHPITSLKGTLWLEDGLPDQGADKGTVTKLFWRLHLCEPSAASPPFKRSQCNS